MGRRGRPMPPLPFFPAEGGVMGSESSTRKLLITTGLPLLLERGYNGLGLQALLSAT
jgi:hypothetical protein